LEVIGIEHVSMKIVEKHLYSDAHFSLIALSKIETLWWQRWAHIKQC